MGMKKTEAIWKMIWKVNELKKESEEIVQMTSKKSGKHQDKGGTKGKN